MSLEDFAKNFASLRKLFSQTRPKFDQQRESGAQYDRVTYEAVTSQDPDGTVDVGGNRVATFGKVLVSPGEFVYVAWKGSQPIGILKFAWQKAHFSPVSVSLKKSIIEELFIATGENGTDVFFRNYDQVTGLEISKFIGAATPTDVFWGMNEDVFGVMTGTDTFYVLRITRPELDEVISEGTQVAIKELLYTIKLSDITVDLTDVSVHLFRDSIEPLFQLDADYGNTFFPISVKLNQTLRTENINNADVTRTFTIKLKGADTITFVQSPNINEQGVRTGNVTASLIGVILDENDDLIYSTSVRFADFGIRQGNLAGLTGQYQLLGEGAVCTYGFFDIAAGFPAIIDQQPIMGFNSFDGNPGGELTAHVTETHTVFINARDAAITFSTIDPHKTLEIEESTNGQTPYLYIEYTNFRVALPTNCFSILTGKGAYVSSGHNTYQSVYGPIATSLDYGEIGKYGVIQSDRSMFVSGLPFDPDGVPDRSVQILTNDDEQTRFETERTDGWDAFNQHPNVFFPVNLCSQVKWRAPASEIIDRYEVRVTALPFWAVGGAIYSFVSVLRRPYNDPASGLNDPIQVGAFVLLDDTLLVTLLPYTNVSEETLPQLMTGNSKHVLWRKNLDWFITDLLTGVTTQAGTNADAPKVQAMLFLNPDVLYMSLEDTDTEPIFVTLLKDNLFHFDQSDPNFPPSEGPPLDELAVLKELDPKILPQVTSYQAIDDQNLVPHEENP